MKITYRIPTEQYAYVEIEREEETITPKEIRSTYYNLSQAFKPTVGMSDKEVDAWLDNMFLEKGNSTDVWAKRSPEQEKWLKCIKRSLSRVANKVK